MSSPALARIPRNDGTPSPVRLRGPRVAPALEDTGRHNAISGPFHIADAGERAEFEALVADLCTTCRCSGAAMKHWVLEMAAAMWRQRWLVALEERVMAEGGGTAPSRLPSLATIIRYRSRLAADYRMAEENIVRLQEARRLNPPDERAGTTGSDEDCPPRAAPQDTGGGKEDTGGEDTRADTPGDPPRSGDGHAGPAPSPAIATAALPAGPDPSPDGGGASAAPVTDREKSGPAPPDPGSRQP